MFLSVYATYSCHLPLHSFPFSLSFSLSSCLSLPSVMLRLFSSDRDGLKSFFHSCHFKSLRSLSSLFRASVPFMALCSKPEALCALLSYFAVIDHRTNTQVCSIAALTPTCSYLATASFNAPIPRYVFIPVLPPCCYH